MAANAPLRAVALATSVVPAALASSAVALLAWACVVPSASAQDAATRARRLFEDGVALSDRGELELAVERFRSSARLVERPSTLFNLALALRELGRVSEAIEVLERFLAIADATVDDARRTQARTWLTALRARGGTLVLDYDPPHADVRVDGERVQQDSPLVLDLGPGPHRVELAAPGRAAEALEITISPGERIARRVSLEPEAGASETDWVAIVGWSAVGLGAAALGCAVVATVAREDQVARFDGPECDPTTWGTRRDLCPELRAEIDATTGAAISLWITGAVLVGAGTTLLVVAPGDGSETATACAPSIAPRELGIGCRARF